VASFAGASKCSLEEWKSRIGSTLRIVAIVQMQSEDFNKFLALQLKIQKAREGFDVKLVSPIEFDAVLYLTYDLCQFVVKPTDAYPAFDAIVVPILAITTMTTTDPSAVAGSNPLVHLRLTLPPFALSLAFSTDCRPFSSFLESLEFLRITLNPRQVCPAEREVHELRKTNDDLHTAIDGLRSVKVHQDRVIQELTRLLATLNSQA
jgi:hypothetical protein